MKLKTTKKQIKRNTSDNLFSVGYCDLQYLLKYKNAFAFSSGVYGWSCDYYELELCGTRIIISTGYQPIGRQLPSTLIKKYDPLAKNIIKKTFLDHDRTESEINTLIDQFLKDVIDFASFLN